MFEQSLKTPCPQLSKFTLIYTYKGSRYRTIGYYPGAINRNFILRDLILKSLGSISREDRDLLLQELGNNITRNFTINNFYVDKMKTRRDGDKLVKEVSHYIEYGVSKVPNHYIWELTGEYSCISKFPNAF